MRLTRLAESDLGITEEEVAALFQPFVQSRAEVPEWRREVARRQRRLLGKSARSLLLRWLPGRRRDEATVKKEYSRAWQSVAYDSYSLLAAPAKYTPWEWDGRQMFASDVGATRVRQLLLIRIIERLRPQSVLEVGCGNGINLLLLACRFPDIAFTGIELTEAGHEAARRLQRLERLPQPMQDYAPLPLVDPTAFRRIRFLQGNATDLPFPDGSFDLVMTVLALEQMERVRDQALQQIARVARRHTLMVEPFADVNQRFWSRLYVLWRNYFRGRIEDLRTYGLQPRLALSDFPQEAFLKVCAVLAEKTGRLRPGQ